VTGEHTQKLDSGMGQGHNSHVLSSFMPATTLVILSLVTQWNHLESWLEIQM
jgi:hypothetical protein